MDGNDPEEILENAKNKIMVTQTTFKVYDDSKCVILTFLLTYSMVQSPS